MKWGVRRASRKAAKNQKLMKKALKYDKKSAKLTKKAEKAHAKNDLETSNRKAVKAAKYDVKAAKLAKRAFKADNDLKRAVLERRSENAKYKAAKLKRKSNTISKTEGYGKEAMKLSIKSDKAAMKAAKARKKIANNKRYIEKMNKKVSSLSKEELAGAYSFVNDYRNN